MNWMSESDVYARLNLPYQGQSVECYMPSVVVLLFLLVLTHEDQKVIEVNYQNFEK